jgi:hypothetical protein
VAEDVKAESGVITAIIPTFSADAFAVASLIDQTPNAVRPVDLQSMLADPFGAMRSFP